MTEDFTPTEFTLNFREEYDDFDTFMDDTRDPIYRTILSAFKNLKKKENVVININANVSCEPVNSELKYTKDNANILVEILNPYFENLEEYELCAEVMKIHK